MGLHADAGFGLGFVLGFGLGFGTVLGCSQGIGVELPIRTNQ